MRRPFARTLDLISGEYGWTDDEILERPLSRIWQIRDRILERQGETARQQLMMREPEVRTIAAFLARLHPSEKGQAQLLREAAAIELAARTSSEKQQQKYDRLPSSQQLASAFSLSETGEMGPRGG